MKRGRALGGRLLRLLATVLAVSLLSFFLINLLPGDPALQILNPLDVSPENIERVHRELGLDQPVLTRYGTWLVGLVTGNFGNSFRANQPVLDMIVTRLPVTLQLTLMSLLIAVLLAVVVGVSSANRRGSRTDQVASTASFALLSVPNFVLGLLLIFFFAVALGWFPATGYTPIGNGLGANLRSLVLPALALAMAPAAVLARVLRTEMITTLNQDYIELARAKGLPPRIILLRHALRPSSLPLITLSGINFGVLLGGSFIIEMLFALPGVGRLGVEAIYGHDYLVVQGVVVVVTVTYVFINFLVDALYRIVDPRVRLPAST